MSRRRGAVVARTVGVLVAVAVTLAACGDDTASPGPGGVAGLPLEGVSVTVGSKGFTENVLLAEMLVQALAANGADVDDRINLGGTADNRQALLAGDIDVYPEYTGTGWTVHLGRSDPPDDRRELYVATAQADLEANRIRWSGLSAFDDTYGFATNPAAAATLGEGFDLYDLAEYLEANPSATICLEAEFRDRADGLARFEAETEFAVPEAQIRVLDADLVYAETRNGSCAFGQVFATDGRIVESGLVVLDGGGVFVSYNGSFTYRDAVHAQQAAALDDLSMRILDGLDGTRMATLNKRVDVDGEDPAEVAQEYLEGLGVL